MNVEIIALLEEAIRERTRTRRSAAS